MLLLVLPGICACCVHDDEMLSYEVDDYGSLNMKLVSVIIPTYNRSDMVCECVESIFNSTYSNLEMIVVDNCSTDDTCQAIRKHWGDRVKLIELEENLMAAGGRNEGIKHATGDYLLFVDNDNIVEADMIELLVEAMEGDDSIGLVGPLSINRYRDNTIWLASGDYQFFSSRPKTLHSGCRPEDVPLKKRYSTCYSPNIMMVRRAAMDAVGGFDRSYFAMYEEADLGYRIKNAGYTEYIITDARTNHLGFVEEGEQSKLRHLGIGSPDRTFHYAKNRTVFMRKYSSWYHRITYYLIFMHVFTIYYSVVALRYGRRDIAKAYVKGAWAGLWTKANWKTIF